MADEEDAVSRAENLVAAHEAEKAEAEAGDAGQGSPDNQLTDVEAVAAVQALMSKPGMQHLCALVVTTWRSFAVIRQEMERIGGKMSPEVFSAMLQGLSTVSMEPFSIVDLRRDLKKKYLPWFTQLAEARVSARKGKAHGPQQRTQS